MAKKRLNPLVKRSRTRSGCLTCRDRHMKCDEHHPVCKNCIKSKRKCYRGIRLNFTQYTYFNPSDDVPNPPRPSPASSLQQQQPPQTYRILDQSITIASLYLHGRRRYRPYLHLHSPAELDEAERTFHDGAGAPRDASPPLPSVTAPAPAPRFPSYSTVDHSLSSLPPPPQQQQPPALGGGALALDPPREGPVHSYPQHPLTGPSPGAATAAPAAPAAPPAPEATTVAIPLPDRFDIASALLKPVLPPATPYAAAPPAISGEVATFIDIVERQRYHWFLDSFNELSIWGSMIPHRCFAAEYSDRRPYLYQALLACSLTHTPDLNPIIDAQTSQIAELHRAADVGDAATVQRTVLELVISIVLVLSGIAGRDHLSPYSRAVCYNQGRLYDALASQVAAACADISGGSDAIVWASAIQSVTILKYFIGKKFGLGPLGPLVGSAQYPPGLEAPIPPSMGPSLFCLNAFEVAELNSGFARAQFPQLSHHGRGNITGLSDSLKLRQLVWHVIKLEYIANNPQDSLRFDLTPPIALQRDPQPPPADPGSSSTTTTTVTTTVPHTFSLPPVSGVDEYYPPPSVLANPRGIAINLLREHATAVAHAHDAVVVRDCRYRGQFIFRMIDDSAMEPTTKAKWHGYFDWTWR